jgi:hypothetical protein
MEALITGEIDADGADFSEESEHEVDSSDVRFNIKRPENPQKNIAVDEEVRNQTSGDNLPVSLVCISVMWSFQVWLSPQHLHGMLCLSNHVS